MDAPDKTKSTGDVIADIHYFSPTGEPIPTSSWKPRYLGIQYEHTRRMTIHDVRLTSRIFNLETNGFQFIELQPRQRVTLASDEHTIRREYYPELESLVKRL